MRWMVWHLSPEFLFSFLFQIIFCPLLGKGSNTVWRVLRKWGLRDELQSWRSWFLTCVMAAAEKKANSIYWQTLSCTEQNAMIDIAIVLKRPLTPWAITTAHWARRHVSC